MFVQLPSSSCVLAHLRFSLLLLGTPLSRHYARAFGKSKTFETVTHIFAASDDDDDDDELLLAHIARSRGNDGDCDVCRRAIGVHVCGAHRRLVNRYECDAVPRMVSMTGYDPLWTRVDDVSREREICLSTPITNHPSAAAVLLRIRYTITQKHTHHPMCRWSTWTVTSTRRAASDGHSIDAGLRPASAVRTPNAVLNSRQMWQSFDVEKRCGARRRLPQM